MTLGQQITSVLNKDRIKMRKRRKFGLSTQLRRVLGGGALLSSKCRVDCGGESGVPLLLETSSLA